MSVIEGQENPPTHEGNKSWIDAHYDPVASLYTFTQCIELSDISADTDHKLIIADLGTGSYDMKLKVYKGVVTFYMDTNEPRTPAVAVASGPYIYIYKNLRPYFKFTLPTMEINQVENDLWNQVKADKIDLGVLREMLDNLRSEGATLTVRSLKFLQLGAQDMSSFASVYKDTPLKRQKSMTEDDAVSCLVLGTESKNIYVLDPEAFTVLTTMELPAVPVFLSVTGLYDVEFRLVVACRNGGIYSLRRDDKSAKCVVELNSQPVGLQRVAKHIVVGCTDDHLHCFTNKGKKLWHQKMPASIMTMETMDHKQKGYQAVLVALSNFEVHVYRDKYLVNSIKTEDIVTGIKFGRFGREDCTLVMTTKGGGLLIKILKRTAKFEEKDVAAGPPAAQNTKLDLPKKTKLFVDQTLRERENAVSMHRQFQHDLYRLRLETARSYVRTLEHSLNPVSTNPSEPLKIAAHVQGIGPTFKLTVTLQNTSTSTPSIDLQITFMFDLKLYALQRTLIQVPMLVPGVNYAFETMVESLSEKGIADVIKVLVMRRSQSAPIITAVISMPIAEAALL